MTPDPPLNPRRAWAQQLRSVLDQLKQADPRCAEVQVLRAAGRDEEAQQLWSDMDSDYLGEAARDKTVVRLRRELRAYARGGRRR